MKQVSIPIENLKCHGCAATIKKGLLKIEGVESLNVDVENSKVDVSFEGTAEDIDTIKAKLAQMGYPESGNNNTLLMAKSFVSCAVGRITKE